VCYGLYIYFAPYVYKMTHICVTVQVTHMGCPTHIQPKYAYGLQILSTSIENWKRIKGRTELIRAYNCKPYLQLVVLK